MFVHLISHWKWNKMSEVDMEDTFQFCRSPPSNAAARLDWANTVWEELKRKYLNGFSLKMTKVNPRVALKGMPLGKNDWEPWIKNSSQNYYDVSMSNQMSKRISHWTMLLDFFFLSKLSLRATTMRQWWTNGCLIKQAQKTPAASLWLLRCSCATTIPSISHKDRELLTWCVKFETSQLNHFHIHLWKLSVNHPSWQAHVASF